MGADDPETGADDPETGADANDRDGPGGSAEGDLFPERIGTDRLRLAALTADTVDTLEYYRIPSGRADGDFERVTRYAPWDPHDHPGETPDFLQRLSERREAGANADYVVRPREGEDGAGEIAGAAGLTLDPERRLGTLGTWLRRPFWGRGYAGEASRALTRVAFERLDRGIVTAVARADNGPSNRALEKFVTDLGGRREGVVRNGWHSPVDDRPHDEVRYSVTRRKYRETTG